MVIFLIKYYTVVEGLLSPERWMLNLPGQIAKCVYYFNNQKHVYKLLKKGYILGNMAPLITKNWTYVLDHCPSGRSNDNPVSFSWQGQPDSYFNYISWYFMEFKMPCTLTRFQEPLEEKQPHNNTMLTGYFWYRHSFFTPNPPWILVAKFFYFLFMWPENMITINIPVAFSAQVVKWQKRLSK